MSVTNHSICRNFCFSTNDKKIYNIHKTYKQSRIIIIKGMSNESNNKKFICFVPSSGGLQNRCYKSRLLLSESAILK